MPREAHPIASADASELADGAVIGAIGLADDQWWVHPGAQPEFDALSRRQELPRDVDIDWHCAGDADLPADVLRQADWSVTHDGDATVVGDGRTSLVCTRPPSKTEADGLRSLLSLPMAAGSLLSTRVGGLSPNVRGSLYMVIGSLGYVTNDALIRAATDEGLDVYQALFLRGLAMSAIFAAATRMRGPGLRRDQLSRPLVLRVVAELIGTALFFGALVQLEFANAQTILLIVPFAVTVVAALVFGESVSRRQYAAVLAGFVGVLLVVQPATDGFSVWSIAVVGAAAMLTIREFATRSVPTDVPASSIALVTAVGITVMTGVIATFTGWNAITLRALVLVLCACVCLVVGYVFTIETVRVGDLGVSAPFRYTTLLGAVVFGYVLFDEIPNALTIVGCSIIVLAGLWAIALDRNARSELRAV